MEGGFPNLNPIMIKSNQSPEYNWDTSQIWKLYSWRLISSHPFLQSVNWLGSFWSGEVSWGQCQRSDIFGHFQIKRSSRTKREKCKLWNLLWAVSAVCENQEIYLGKSAIFYVKMYGVFVLSVETKTYILEAVLSTTFPLRTCLPSCILQFAFVILHYFVFVYFLAILF